MHGHTPWSHDPLSSDCEDEFIRFDLPDDQIPESTVGRFTLDAGDLVSRAKRINLDAGCGFRDEIRPNPLVFAEFLDDHFRMHAVHAL
ncbi:hypothetical protein [Salipiger mucosus]|uniref:Uncharacterized protein n=1 Tax=Salipiger mucosus DSM 16094 TaxID=1123237 RepID=S9QAX3_9RHOB|nr:hypothetical protein [Salipiger mucosus]EPX76793.1 hypothetical protein Salmuc_04679 [Salipiger mucosus DSM 16094]